MDELACVEEEIVETCEHGEEAALEEENECEKLLTTLQTETVFVDPDLNPTDTSSVPGKSDDPAFMKVTDPEIWKTLLQDVPGDGAHDADHTDRLPRTLLEAMSGTACRWNSMFRLAVRLRSAKGGIDTRWIPNARNVRRTSTKLNWYQCLCCLKVLHIFNFL